MADLFSAFGDKNKPIMAVLVVSAVTVNLN